MNCPRKAAEKTYRLAEARCDPGVLKKKGSASDESVVSHSVFLAVTQKPANVPSMPSLPFFELTISA